MRFGELMAGNEVLERLRGDLNSLRSENTDLRQRLATAEAREMILQSRNYLQMSLNEQATKAFVTALWEIIESSTDQHSKAIARAALSNAPGLCEDCEERAAVPGEECCPDCRDNRAERAYERQQEDGETLRGGEASAYHAEQQDKARRLK